MLKNPKLYEIRMVEMRDCYALRWKHKPELASAFTQIEDQLLTN